MSKKWIVSFAIEGTGNAEVEADTEAEALQKAKDFNFSSDPEANEWDINTASYRGGYIEVTEA